MIDLKNICCASSLYDQCGIVFEYEGSYFRALLPRGVRLFDLLSKDNWMERLFGSGLALMKKTDLDISGYHGVIELEKLNPIVPPFMWSTNMLCEAGLVVCRLSKELLKRDLIIWDLKGMTNMTFSAKRGPLLLDIGAIYKIQELENRILHTSVESLLDQIVSSFYAPLWFAYGPLGHLRSVKNLLEYRKTGEQGFSFATSLLRRLTMGWKMIPGLLKAKTLLHFHQYDKFFDSINNKLQTWYDKSISETPDDLIAHSDYNNGEDSDTICQIMKNTLGGLEGKIVFDLSPERGIWLQIADSANTSIYLITQDAIRAENIFAWRKRHDKPVLPILCDIWDRSFRNCCALRNGCDVVCILPNIIETAIRERVPMEFIGRVLSFITRDAAIIGVRRVNGEIKFPGFVSTLQPDNDPVEFLLATVGKYFKKHEIIEHPERLQTSVLIFHK